MSHYGNYDPSSFGWTPDKSQVVPFTWRDQSFPAGAHRLAVPVFTGLLDQLADEHGFGPAGADNPGDWGYFYRPIRSGGTLSFHSYGLALDVKAPANPYSASGMPAHSIVDKVAIAAARAHGCEWGGAWSSPHDTMHFEVHLSPDEIRGIHPAPVRGAGLPVLRRGSKGDLVRNVQRRLNLQKTGVFDIRLDGCVRQYQRIHRLAADGVIGPATWSALLHQPILPGERLLRLGSTGEDVAWLQERLGLHPAKHPAFGQVTQATMVAWERKWKRTADGIVEREDWAKLGILAAVG